jgi:hypothetical protein
MDSGVDRATSSKNWKGGREIGATEDISGLLQLFDSKVSGHRGSEKILQQDTKLWK